MHRIIRHYIANKGAVVTIDFVTISLVVFLIMFLVVEMTLMYFFIQSAQKAAQIGVRVAIVSDPMVSGLPATNGLASGGIFGTACNNASAPCTSFTRMTCTGDACETVPFTRMLTRMQGFLSGLKAENVTVSYAYEGLGYAGGPIIPTVTVRIEGVPHQTGILGRILGATGGNLSKIPAVSATLTGEDLSESGA